MWMQTSKWFTGQVYLRYITSCCYGNWCLLTLFLSSFSFSSVSLSTSFTTVGRPEHQNFKTEHQIQPSWCWMCCTSVNNRLRFILYYVSICVCTVAHVFRIWIWNKIKWPSWSSRRTPSSGSVSSRTASHSRSTSLTDNTNTVHSVHAYPQNVWGIPTCNLLICCQTL